MRGTRVSRLYPLFPQITLVITNRTIVSWYIFCFKLNYYLNRSPTYSLIFSTWLLFRFYLLLLNFTHKYKNIRPSTSNLYIINSISINTSNKYQTITIIFMKITFSKKSTQQVLDKFTVFSAHIHKFFLLSTFLLQS